MPAHKEKNISPTITIEMALINYKLIYIIKYNVVRYNI